MECHERVAVPGRAILAALLGQGDYPAARAVQEDVLDRARRVLVEDHLHTIHYKRVLDALDRT